MKKKVKVFLFSTFKTSFIKDDFNHLNNNYISKWVYASGINAIYQILKNCYNHRVYIVWFASTYSALIIFLSKIFNKNAKIGYMQVKIYINDENFKWLEEVINYLKQINNMKNKKMKIFSEN